MIGQRAKVLLTETAKSREQHNNLVSAVSRRCVTATKSLYYSKGKSLVTTIPV